jgi:hypothetical protein
MSNRNAPFFQSPVRPLEKVGVTDAKSGKNVTLEKDKLLQMKDFFDVRYARYGALRKPTRNAPANPLGVTLRYASL